MLWHYNIMWICVTVCEWVSALPSVLWRCWLGDRKGIQPVKNEWWGVGVVVCLERGADLHMVQLMPLPLTVSCSSKIQIGFTFLVPAHLGSPRQRAVERVCVCVRAFSALAFSVLTLLFRHQEEHRVCRTLIEEVLVWLSVWSEVQMS